jgi:hypothetical protein
MREGVAMHRLTSDLVRWVEGLTPQHWLVLLAAVIVVGLVCLRGFGSRSRY